MPDTKRRIPPEPPPVPEPVEPPYYEATAMLPVGLPGQIPVYAYGVGDHVPPDDVERHGWGALVKVPERFAGVLAPPSAMPGGLAPGPGAHTKTEEE